MASNSRSRSPSRIRSATPERWEDSLAGPPQALIDLCIQLRDTNSDMDFYILQRENFKALCQTSKDQLKPISNATHEKARRDINDKIRNCESILKQLGNCKILDCTYHNPKPIKPNNAKRTHDSSSEDEDELQPHKLINSDNIPSLPNSPTPSQINLDLINDEMDEITVEQNQINDTSGFRTPPRHKTARANNTQPPAPSVATSNRFQPLRPAHLDSNDTTQSNVKPHTLMVKIITDVKSLCSQINSYVTNPPECKIAGEHIKVQFKTIDDYRTGTSCLRRDDIGFFIMTPLNMQSLKVVIKGIHPDTNPDEIKDDLIAMGHEVERVAQLRRFKDGTKLPIFQIQIKPGPNMDDIYKIKYFHYVTVTVEKFERTGRVNQCFKCQSFFHSSQNCHFKARCVKCGQQHESKDCTKERHVKPTCANCNGEHPASYRGCPKFPKWRPNTQNQQTRTNPTQRTNTRTNIENRQGQAPHINTRKFTWGQSNHQRTAVIPDQTPSGSSANPAPSVNLAPPTSDTPQEMCWDVMIKLVNDLREQIADLKKQLDFANGQLFKLSNGQTN